MHRRGRIELSRHSDLSMQKNLIIFIKNPVLGKVKTRLAKDVGDKEALSIYYDLLQRCREECRKVNAKRWLYYSDELEQQDAWSEQHFTKRLQSQGDLGERIQDAFDTVNQEGEATIIIGSDCYDLSASIIEAAFEALEEKDFVIGPANDGGYYLLGSTQFHPQLFQQIDWSTSAVFEQTIAQAKELNLSIEVLEELVDLDTLDDVKGSSYPWPKK